MLRETFRSFRRAPRGTIAINMRPVHAAWGGGNQWLHQVTRHLRQAGYAVRFDLKGRVDCILIAHSKPSESLAFGVDEVRAYRAEHPQTACLHRVNENDQRKGTSFMDPLLAEANELADYTVFISDWLREYHAARWFDTSKPHAVITHGADSKIFHPGGGAEWKPGETLRLVTHHWSDHWMKGFGVYQAIDRLITDGQLPDTELWVIGRWPREIRWKAAKTFGPTHGPALARLLKRCHVYVTASQWEPGGMHFIEGAQCGLPVLYHVNGGGIVEVARRLGIGFDGDVRSAIAAVRERYAELRRTVVQDAPSGDSMCVAYGQAIEHTMAITHRVESSR